MALGAALCFFFSSNMFRGVRIFFITVFLYMKLMMRISPVYLVQEMRSNSRDDMASSFTLELVLLTKQHFKNLEVLPVSDRSDFQN